MGENQNTNVDVNIKNAAGLENENIKKMFDNLDVDENITDLFYESVKSFFDVGFELAKKLNFELFEEFMKEREDKGNK